MSVDRIVAPATLANGAQALPTPSILVDSTAGFPAPAGVTTTTVTVGVLPQVEIEITDTTGLATPSGYVLITPLSGPKQLVWYTGITPSGVGVRGILKNCQGGLGAFAAGALVEAAAQILVTTDTGEQLVVYTNTDATHFLGSTGGTGTIPDDAIIQPTVNALDDAAGEFVIDFGMPVGQITTPAQIAAIKWDARINLNPVIPTGFPPAPLVHCHKFQNVNVSGLTIIPNTAILPITDNSQIILTGTVRCNCGVAGLSSIKPYTLVLSRVSACVGFSLQIDSYVHQLTRLVGTQIQSFS